MSIHALLRRIVGLSLAAWSGLCLLLPGPVAAATTDIASPAALVTALAGAGPGTELVLAPGDYGTLRLRGGGGSATAPLVLRSADPADPARFDRMDIEGTAHLLLDGVMLDYRFSPGDPRHLRPFTLTDVRDVTIRNALFDGDVARGVSARDDGRGFAFGLGVQRSDGVRVEHSEFRSFLRGLIVSESRNVALIANDLHDLRSDGMDFAQVSGLRIEGNHLHAFATAQGTDDHADMIQIWTNGTTAPSTDIVIRDNVLDAEGRGYTQSIFLRNDMVDRGKAGREMFYRDITIEGNVIINAHLHGITVGETVGLRIERNTLVQDLASRGEANDRPLWVPQIRVSPAAAKVRIARNAVAVITGFEGQPDWRLERNVTIQNRTRAEGGFYGQIFADPFGEDPADLGRFAYRRGGPLDGVGIGAPRLQDAAPAIRAGRR